MALPDSLINKKILPNMVEWLTYYTVESQLSFMFYTPWMLESKAPRSPLRKVTVKVYHTFLCIRIDSIFGNRWLRMWTDGINKSEEGLLSFLWQLFISVQIILSEHCNRWMMSNWNWKKLEWRKYYYFQKKQKHKLESV